MYILGLLLVFYFAVAFGIELGKPDYTDAELKEKLTQATELLKWALHSDPEHDNLDDFDAKWKEAEQFLKEVEA